MSNWYPPPSRPRPADGIKARSRRGAIAQTWWSERFIAVLESIGVGNRLERGRTYARGGQVVEFSVGAGAVTATVQGSRARPYRVRIGLPAFDKAAWRQVCQALADDASYSAKLLAGHMPSDIEDVFASVGLSLFPAGERELAMDCTCPDWEVPCKHLAGVFYLLAESFDSDPFGILAWRGRERDDLLAVLSALRSGVQPADHGEHANAAVPLDECLDSFFLQQAPLPPRATGRAGSDAVLYEAPATPLTIRGTRLTELLRPAYLALSDDSRVA